MKNVKHFWALMAVLAALFTSGVFAAEEGQKLFVNLTSDDMNRAAMAIGFSTKVLEDKKIPVTIFLNAEGVRLADKTIPGHTHVSGKSLQAMLAEFISAGGRVIICPMCMEAVGGMSKADLIPDVEMGGPAVTWPLLFAEGTTVLSY